MAQSSQSVGRARIDHVYHNGNACGSDETLGLFPIHDGSLDNDDVTPLMKATEAGQLDIVKLILSKDSGKKTLSSQKTSTKETALMIACKKGFHKIVKFIMENSDTDMNLDQKDQDDSNVFHHAAKHDNILCVMIEICTEKYKNYKDYLNLKDKGGCVALHLAATSGSYRNVELLLENDVPYNTLSSGNRTALHCAASTNIDTVEALLDFVKNKIDKQDALKQFIDEVDSRLQTSLHIAASNGKWQTVSVLLENGAAIKCDEENETALHLASRRGCAKTVQLLIQHDPAIVNIGNCVGQTAAMFAAYNGHTEVLEMLLDSNANICAEKRLTCLDLAVQNTQPDTAKAILKRPNWKETMEKSYFSPDRLLAMMVIKMPNVAIDVLNKCEEKGKNETAYDFFALQTRGECGENYVTDMAALGTMAKKSRIECLNHAVVQKFMEQKWSLRARKWYWGCLSIYAIFLLFFTTYISLFTEGYASDARCMIISRIICYVFAILNVIRELFQLYHRKSQYFTIQSNYLDMVMYICVFIFLPYDKKNNMQLQAGAIAIFLGWINFTWFLKRFPTYGIYIIMTKKIFVTFIKVFVPVSFFIIAFSMTFFVLLHKHENVYRNGTTHVPDENEGFGNIGRSFVTSFAMMVGEVDYRDIFLQQTGKNFALIQLFLVLFLIIMSILLMNLLTGLAVGDIDVIMKRSLAEKRIQRAMLIVDLDKHLDKYPRMEAKYVEPLKERNVRAMSYVDKMFPPLDIEEETSQECEITGMKEELNSMKNTLEELNSMKNTLEELNSMKNTLEELKSMKNTLEEIKQSLSEKIRPG